MCWAQSVLPGDATLPNVTSFNHGMKRNMKVGLAHVCLGGRADVSKLGRPKYRLSARDSEQCTL